MREQRNIFEVIDAVIDALPEDHRDPFFKLRAGFVYKAPELMGECWAAIGAELRRVAEWPPVEQWEWDCAAIIMDKTEDEIRSEVGL